MSHPHGREAESDQAPDTAASHGARPCGCQRRKEALNDLLPGLGDGVAAVADPIYERWQGMPALLKPDVKAVVWLLIGAFVAPRVLAMVR